MKYRNDILQNKSHYAELIKLSENPLIAGSWNGVNQDFRYVELIDYDIFRDASILEIGCGTGGFLQYLLDNNVLGEGAYVGIDILKEFQTVNEKKYPQYRFLTMDILEETPDECFDIVVLCGVFNIKTDNGDEYMKELLSRSWNLCRKMLSFNFISTYVNFTDETMQYHSPTDVMEFCIREMSPKLKMYHHYAKCDVSCKVYR